MQVDYVEFFKTGLRYDHPDREISDTVIRNKAKEERYIPEELENFSWQAEEIDNYLLINMDKSQFDQKYDYAVVHCTHEWSRCYFVGATEVIYDNTVTSTEEHTTETVTVLKINLVRDWFAERYTNGKITEAFVSRRMRYDNDAEPYSPVFDYKTLDCTDRHEALAVNNDFKAWIYFSFNETNGGYTYPRLGCFPIPDFDNATVTLLHGDVTFDTMSFRHILAGYFEESMGLDPEAINHVWIGTTPPSTYAYTDVSVTVNALKMNQTVLTLRNWAVRRKKRDETGNYTKACFYTDIWAGGPTPYPKGNDAFFVTDLGGEHKSVSKEMIFFNTPTMRDYYVFPNDIPFRYAYRKLIMTHSSAYEVFAFTDSTYDNFDNAYADALAKGTVVTVPCSEIDVTSNAWSSYVYSGQREYDITSKKLAREQTYAEGRLNLDTQTAIGIGNAVSQMAMMAGFGMVAGAGTVASTARGAAVSGGGNIISTAINYYATRDQLKKQKALSAQYDRYNQNSADSLYQNQSSSVIIAGDLLLWVTDNGVHSEYYLTSKTPDERALKVEQARENLYGFEVDEYYDTVPTELKLREGYLRVDSCKFTSQSVEANTHIEELLRQGVRIRPWNTETEGGD